MNSTININFHFFTPFILEPTRLQSKTLIDNIFFNTLEFQSLSGNLFGEISDQLIQFLILEGFMKQKCFPKTTYLEGNFNEREFEEVICSMN